MWARVGTKRAGAAMVAATEAVSVDVVTAVLLPDREDDLLAAPAAQPTSERGAYIMRQGQVANGCDGRQLMVSKGSRASSVHEPTAMLGGVIVTAARWKGQSCTLRRQI